MLKIGDTFVDGGFKYEVVGIHELGYAISKRIGNADEPIVNEEPTIEEKPSYTKTQINRLPNIELEALCELLGVEKGTGSEMKKALIKKLEL